MESGLLVSIQIPPSFKFVDLAANFSEAIKSMQFSSIDNLTR